jgi:hypothetical protein
MYYHCHIILLSGIEVGLWPGDVTRAPSGEISNCRLFGGQQFPHDFDINISFKVDKKVYSP